MTLRRMSAAEFEAALERLGFLKTGVRTNLGEEWRHLTGVSRFITEAHRVNPDRLSDFLVRIAKSIGIQ